MTFVLIPAGTFMMGSHMSPEEIVQKYGGTIKWFKREHPQHVVNIQNAIYLQTTPVTQKQWQSIMGNNPSQHTSCGGDCPVEQVSWYDAQDFITKLNQKEQTDTYRLPSESEWEYACRAGTSTEFSFGDDASDLNEYAWYKENGEYKTHPVATKKSNSWGLCDMHGNIWQWTEDDWHVGYKNAPNDGRAWVANPRGSNRLVRGGCLDIKARYCRSAYRDSHKLDDGFFVIGFRLAKSVTHLS